MNTAGDFFSLFSFVHLSFVSSNPRDNMYAFVIKGSAFLWHQVRCMVAVLFLIGQHKEEPSLIDELLNVEKDIGTPEYAIASEVPLVLWECGFKDIQWNYDIGNQPTC
jgi:tRNA pseudouridine(38-40) synthase